MKKTLGLDLGTNSLGWAILDDITGDILDKGVVIFPEGVDLDAGTSLETPAAVRRAARMGRRMKFRRKLRKWRLLDLLIDAGMCPLTHEELDAWKKKDVYPLSNHAFIDWLKSTDTTNPYRDRAAAAEGKVPPLVLGRALYHLAQRRGFKSSRKDEAVLVDEESGEQKKLDKETGRVKGDIAALNTEIAAAGCKTLGQYFCRRLDEQKDALAKTRIRCRYTGRVEHYMTEFTVIMDAQGYAGDAPFRRDVYRAIFMQRPLRSQKHLVGPCPLEHANPRAQIGHPAFEEFRMLAFVNNLAFEKDGEDYRDENGNLRHPLTAADRALVCSAFMKVSARKFGEISKLFKKDPRFKCDGLRFHYYDDDDAITPCQTRPRLVAAFGDVPFDEQTVFDALTFFDDSEKLAAWFRKHYPSLDDKAIAKLVSIHPKEGNAQYSLKAINRILPFLRKGHELSFARFLAKIPDVVPDFAKREEEIVDHLNVLRFEHRRDKRDFADLAPQIRSKTPPPPTLYERYERYLRDDLGVDDAGWRKLYLRGDEAYEPETEYRCNGKTVRLARPRLPPVQLGMIRNPLVQRAMTTLRRLVNYLGEHGKLDPADTIRIELARDVNDFATRKAWQTWQKRRAELREKAAAEIANAGKAATEDAIERYILWEEQAHTCLYTGKAISLEELLAGNAFDVEHTIPRSLSGDDSLANKTICDAAYNRQTKQGRVPRDCPNIDEIEVRLRSWRDHLKELEKNFRNQTRKCRGITDPAARGAARIKAFVTRFERDYWRDKLRRFELEASKLEARAGELGGFKRRQLVDTGIMSSHAVELLKSVYPATFSVNGSATAFARKAWGIQGDGAKDRSEHTHHAKDAMVIAALTPGRFTAICTALKDDGAQRIRESDVCPEPYPAFAEKVRLACEEILVKHVLRQTTLRQSSKRTVLAKAHHVGGDAAKPLVSAVLSRGDTVRGPLHKDTFYGCIVNPETGRKTTVERIPVSGKVKDIKKEVPAIVDPAIREIITRFLEGKSPEMVIVAGDILMPSGVPIKKVRIVSPARFQHPNIIRQHAFKSKFVYKTPVYAGSAEDVNFRMGIFFKDGKYSYETESSLTWAQTHQSTEYLPPHKKEGFLGYVFRGTMAIVKDGFKINTSDTSIQKSLSSRLYYVRVLPSAKDSHVELQHHLVAVPKKEIRDRSSEINPVVPHALIRTSANNVLKSMLFEGIHFRMNLDGSIHFLER